MQKKSNKTLIINLFGGPSAGKSTTAYYLCGELKSMGLNCELATEYVKDLVYEKRTHDISNQITCFGEQLRRIERLVEQVDIIITDSPLLLNAFYNRSKYDHLVPLVVEVHRSYNNVNYFLERAFEFHSEGRIHTEEQSKAIDEGVKKLLNEFGEPYSIIKGDNNSRYSIISDLTLHNKRFQELLSKSVKPVMADKESV